MRQVALRAIATEAMEPWRTWRDALWLASFGRSLAAEQNGTCGLVALTVPFEELDAAACCVTTCIYMRISIRDRAQVLSGHASIFPEVRKPV